MSPHSHPTCPRCDTLLSGSEVVCPQCRMILAGTRLAEAPCDQALCPVCKIGLYEAVFADQPVLHCGECKGMGLKREAMMKLQPFGAKELVIGTKERGHRRPPYFEPRPKPPFLICPACKKRMKETVLAKTTVDLCGTCGALWLEEPKMDYLNDILGPYKWKVSKEKK